MKIMHTLPESWLSYANEKLVVVFYAGVNFQAKYHASIIERAQSYINLLSALGCSTSNMRGVVLWWFDDGSLRKLIEAVDDENERKKLERTYMWTLQIHLATAVHDESMDFNRALAWGDVYYGDVSPYEVKFKETGKFAALYTFVNYGQSLEIWLENAFVESTSAKLPKEWEEIIYGKKVALLCIQPQTLLSVGQHAVTLIENLIYLTQERKDSAVWWLVDKELDKAVALLSNDLKLSFEEVKRKFLESPSTIYDKSGEVGRALEYSDVTFGNPRKVWGRSAVRTVIDPPYSNLKNLPKCPQVGELCRDGQKIYFTYTVRNVFGVLCEADLDTDKVKVLCRLPNSEELTDWGLDYLLPVKDGHKIIMPPLFSNEAFLEYDITSESLTKISCEKKVWEPNLERYGAFGPMAEWGDSIFFMGNRNGLLVEYRKANGKYIYHEEWLKRLNFEKKPKFGGSELIGDIWYLVVIDMPVLLVMDMRSLTANILKLPLPKKFQPRTLSRCGDDLWISPWAGNSLACIHIDTQEMELVECPMVSSNQIFPFSSVVPWGQRRLIFPYFADDMYIWQTGSHQAEQVPELTRKLVRPFEEADLRNEVFWTRQSEDGGSFLSFRERGTELIEFWPESSEVLYHRLRMEPEDDVMLKDVVHSWNLKNLLKPLTDEIEQVSWRKFGTTGKRILETIKENL
ncbi:hypothetical protein [Selenomonas ruminantium]|uniref:hypothetical protein n=1 Tax=Selenomonas ruminantium TaxID=971 RepID=UPI001315AB5D|nr:hypothetical protein [Selenomonas ruminantium]